MIYCQGLGSRDQLCELHHFMHMYNYFLKARVSLRTLSSLVINLFTQVAIVLELALVSSHPDIMIRTAPSPEYSTHSSILASSHSPALRTLEVCSVHGL